MFDELLPYYNQELHSLREAAVKFARAYPKSAKHLSTDSGKVEDPDVARLIESFAFLTAQLRYKLDDDFPEIAESLLNVLYPHYLAPIPSFSVVQFQHQPELTPGYIIPKHSLIDTGSNYEEPCSFRTVYPVTLWPIDVIQARMQLLPFDVDVPVFKEMDKVKATISITLRCSSPEIRFAEIFPNTLRFFLNGPIQHTSQIYKLIFNHALGVSLATPTKDDQAIFLNKSHLKPLGFGVDEKMLPFSAHTSQGYDLLTEYFIFPEKFLFFELTALTSDHLQAIDNELEIFIYLDSSNEELEQVIDVNYFKLGCSPVVNLFPQTAEPFALTQTLTEYPVIADARRSAAALDVYSIQNVKIFTEQGEEIVCFPFYNVKYSSQNQEKPYFWHANRRIGARDSSELFLSFTHLDLSPVLEDSLSIVHVETLCSNADLPTKLPFSNDKSFLQLNINAAPVWCVRCLLPFTPSVRPTLRNGMRWKLLAHLSLNYLSLSQEKDAVELLKEMLKLYNFKDTTENHQLIDSLVSVHCKRITARSSNGMQEAFCQGVEVVVQFNEISHLEGEQYLFFQILEQFFARYTTINSFTRLIVASIQKGILYQWLPRAGSKTLL